jgi:hypothetical protein
MKSWEQVSLATVFAIAMGFLEAAVVVYLRKLYYPEGFAFPLKPLPDQVAFTELGRELSTLVMLVSAGLMLGRNGLERFAYFLLTFAVWDLVYYGGLKLVLDWPASLLTWDILFLIPLPWTGPVLAPVCAAISMIVLGLLLIRVKERHPAAKVRPLTWVWLIGGSVVFILACVWDYTTFVVNNYGWASLYTTEQDALFAINRQYTPRDFNWFLFGLAMLLIWTGIGSFGWRNRYYL